MSKKIPRIVVPILALSIIALVLVPITAFSGINYSNTYNLKIGPLDSTTARLRTIDSLVGTGLAPIFRIKLPENCAGVIKGTINLVVTKVDTNSAGEYIDTTKDTIFGQIYTANEDRGIEYKQIDSSTLRLVPTTGTTGVTTKFNIMADSTLQIIYFRFIKAVQDSDYTVAEDPSVYVHYRATVKLEIR